MNNEGDKLSKYYNNMSYNYRHLALFEITLNYYLMYEIWEEGANKYIDISGKECELINRSVKMLASGEKLSGLIPEYERMRKQNSDKMNVVTAYVDRLIVYEHVINRTEMRFAMSESERKEWLDDFDADAYIDELVSFIFSGGDNAEVTENLRDVYEQLPVRMARSKYIDIIKHSIELYADSDKDSLDGFIYMLRTAAMLYEPEGYDEYFTEFKPLINELSEADFTDIKEGYFKILQEKVSAASADMNDISDIYMIYQGLINMLYVYALNEEGAAADNKNEYNICCMLLNGIYDVITGNTDDITEADYMLSRLEGMPEKYLDKKISYEARFDKMTKDCAEDDEQVINFKKCMILSSTSVFAEYKSDESEPVTEEYINEVTENIVADITNMIKSYKRPVVRAVMSISLARLPLFFNTSDDIIDYIENSIKGCSDEPELIACVNLLDEIKENYI